MGELTAAAVGLKAATRTRRRRRGKAAAKMEDRLWMEVERLWWLVQCMASGGGQAHGQECWCGAVVYPCQNAPVWNMELALEATLKEKKLEATPKEEGCGEEEEGRGQKGHNSGGDVAVGGWEAPKRSRHAVSRTNFGATMAIEMRMMRDEVAATSLKRGG